jgi:K+-sensing histidine kinase KdpD
VPTSKAIAFCWRSPDSGTGTSRVEQERLFDRPCRTSQAIAAASPGTGLGLTIRGMIVEAHGGRIEVGNEEAPVQARSG